MQLHTSYSSLGRDFKSIFEELVKHIHTQKAEADGLRCQISAAARGAMEAEALVSSRLESALNEERAQAANDRQDLLAQITSLVNKTGETQETRWQSKIDTIRSDIASSHSTFVGEEKKYSKAMDVWSQKENLLVEEVLKSRDALKSRMKKDWTVGYSHSNPMCSTDECYLGRQRAEHCNPDNDQIGSRGNNSDSGRPDEGYGDADAGAR